MTEGLSANLGGPIIQGRSLIGRGGAFNPEVAGSTPVVPFHVSWLSGV